MPGLWESAAAGVGNRLLPWPPREPLVPAVPWHLLNAPRLQKNRGTKNSKSAMHCPSFWTPGWFTAVINCHCSQEVRHWQFTLSCCIFLTLLWIFIFFLPLQSSHPFPIGVPCCIDSLILKGLESWRLLLQFAFVKIHTYMNFWAFFIPRQSLLQCHRVTACRNEKLGKCYSCSLTRMQLNNFTIIHYIDIYMSQ